MKRLFLVTLLIASPMFISGCWSTFSPGFANESSKSITIEITDDRNGILDSKPSVMKFDLHPGEMVGPFKNGPKYLNIEVYDSFGGLLHSRNPKEINFASALAYYVYDGVQLRAPTDHESRKFKKKNKAIQKAYIKKHGTKIGQHVAFLSVVVVPEPYKYKSHTIPSGEYHPVMEDSGGVYFKATKPIMIDWVFGRLSHEGGLYFRFNSPTKPMLYIKAQDYTMTGSNLGNVLVNLPSDFKYNFKEKE